MNSTEQSSSVQTIVTLGEVKILVPVLWSLLIFIGLLGNGLVVYVMLRYGEIKTTNCYIVNLGLTDLAFILIVIPLTMMHYVMPSWVLGEEMCKFHMYMIYVTLQATCLTLTAMTIDRYYAIVHPITSMHRRTPKSAMLVNLIIWLVSYLMCVPFAMYHGLKDSYFYGPRVYCRETWPSPQWGMAAISYVVMLTYVMPLVVISVCYALMMRHLWHRDNVHPQHAARSTIYGSPSQEMNSRKLRKATIMVAVVVSLFATFWLPIHVFQLWFKFDPNFPKNTSTYSYKIVAHTLSYASSCVNPFVYSVLGDGFQKAIRRAFPKFFGRNLLLALPDEIPRVGADTCDANGTDGAFVTQMACVVTHQSSRSSATQDVSMHLTLKGFGSPNPVAGCDSRRILLPRPECAVIYEETEFILPGTSDERMQNA